MRNENVCVLSDADFKRAVGGQRDILTLLNSLSSVQKKSCDNYSGKKKCFTQKVQTAADFESGEILFSDFCGGITHDFKLFKESGAAVQPHVLIFADAGCQGIAKIHRNSGTPFKKKKSCRSERREEG